MGRRSTGAITLITVALLFPEGVIQYWGAAGHYTKAGNRFIANALLAKLHLLVDAAARRD